MTDELRDEHAIRRERRNQKDRYGMRVTNTSIRLIARLSGVRALVSRTGPSAPAIDSHEKVEPGDPATAKRTRGA